MSKYLICTVEEYELGKTSGTALDEPVSLHSPVMSPDGTQVLVKGIGPLSREGAISYIAENWEVYEDFPEPEPAPVVEEDTSAKEATEPEYVPANPAATDKV
jgi:hypothetical protein